MSPNTTRGQTPITELDTANTTSHSTRTNYLLSTNENILKNNSNKLPPIEINKNNISLKKSILSDKFNLNINETTDDASDTIGKNEISQEEKEVINYDNNLTKNQ